MRRAAVHRCGPGSLPAPAESVVELDQREPLVELRLREIELRREFVVFTGEYLEVTRATMLIKYFREAIGIFLPPPSIAPAARGTRGPSDTR